MILNSFHTDEEPNSIFQIAFQTISIIPEMIKNTRMIIIFGFTTLDKLELPPYLHILGNFR